MQALWREPDADRRSLKCFVLFSLRGMAAYNYHARVLGRIAACGCCWEITGASSASPMTV